MPLTVSNEVNPIKVTGTTASSTVIYTGKAFIKAVRWYNPTTEGHLCNLTNTDGNIILSMRAGSDNETQYVPLYYSSDGIKCDDLDSGTLYIYLR